MIFKDTNMEILAFSFKFSKDVLTFHFPWSKSAAFFIFVVAAHSHQKTMKRFQNKLILSKVDFLSGGKFHPQQWRSPFTFSGTIAICYSSFTLSLIPVPAADSWCIAVCSIAAILRLFLPREWDLPRFKLSILPASFPWIFNLLRAPLHLWLLILDGVCDTVKFCVVVPEQQQYNTNLTQLLRDTKLNWILSWTFCCGLSASATPVCCLLNQCCCWKRSRPGEGREELAVQISPSSTSDQSAARVTARLRMPHSSPGLCSVENKHHRSSPTTSTMI